MDFLFGVSTTRIVCAKWSQAENISTETHAATTCHRAAQLGIGEHRNREMIPHADARARLENIWLGLKLLVSEEVSMASPARSNAAHGGAGSQPCTVALPTKPSSSATAAPSPKSRAPGIPLSRASS